MLRILLELSRDVFIIVEQPAQSWAYKTGCMMNINPSHPSKIEPSRGPDFVEIEWEVRGRYDRIHGP